MKRESIFDLYTLWTETFNFIAKQSLRVFSSQVQIIGSNSNLLCFRVRVSCALGWLRFKCLTPCLILLRVVSHASVIPQRKSRIFKPKVYLDRTLLLRSEWFPFILGQNPLMLGCLIRILCSYVSICWRWCLPFWNNTYYAQHSLSSTATSCLWLLSGAAWSTFSYPITLVPGTLQSKPQRSLNSGLLPSINLPGTSWTCQALISCDSESRLHSFILSPAKRTDYKSGTDIQRKEGVGGLFRYAWFFSKICCKLMNRSFGTLDKL